MLAAGEDSGSGSSTQPTSPPPLVNYHPSNWFRPETAAQHQPELDTYTFTPAPARTAPPPPALSAQRAEHPATPAPAPAPARDIPSRLNTQAPAPAAESAPTVTYIPGTGVTYYYQQFNIQK